MRREAVRSGAADPGFGCARDACGGVSADVILADYPDLEHEDIRAVLAFAAKRGSRG